ncbi:MAG: 3-isopropylmalate dehydrogenase [Actinobacteria bacterium]|nr:MAG: 3-isopropylmalate dehydrogenase [Actinomycetota bacterium]
MEPRIVTLPGDGIGPEIMPPALELLGAVGDFEFEEHEFGGASIDAHGTALTEPTLDACRRADAVLLAAVGGPRWDSTDPEAPRPEQGLLGLRQGLGLFANLRPVRPLPALYDSSPLRRERIEGTDLLVVRELTGGIYFGNKRRDADGALDECRYSVAEIERIARVAFGAASTRAQSTGGPPRVASVDKANVLDILSDEAAMITGSIGMLPSASLGSPGADGRSPGLFEPVHGSAPDIAGRGIANPLAMFLSAALMLRHGLGWENEAARIESAVDRALESGLRTYDLGGSATTAAASQAVLSLINK